MPSLKERIKSWIATLKPDPYKGMDAAERFEHIHRANDWQDEESVSGPGSNTEQTTAVIGIIESILKEYKPDVLVDIPCGDFGWMSKVDLGNTSYIGGDIVSAIIEANHKKFDGPERRFIKVDLLSDPIPKGDILLVRDCLVHLNTHQIKTIVSRIKKSEIQYLLTTTFTGKHLNHDIHTGDWRPLNLENHPFQFPKPIQVFNERNSENGGKYSDKSLGLWNVNELPDYE